MNNLYVILGIFFIVLFVKYYISANNFKIKIFKQASKSSKIDENIYHSETLIPWSPYPSKVLQNIFE